MGKIIADFGPITPAKTAPDRREVQSRPISESKVSKMLIKFRLVFVVFFCNSSLRNFFSSHWVADVESPTRPERIVEFIAAVLGASMRAGLWADARLFSGAQPNSRGTTAESSWFVLVLVLSRGVRSLFGPTRKLSPWGNFSDGGLNQSIKRRLSWQTFRLIDWLIDDKLTLTWLVYWIFTAQSVFTGAGLKWPNTADNTVFVWFHMSICFCSFRVLVCSTMHFLRIIRFLC